MKIAMICSNEYTTPPPQNVIHASSYIASVLAEGLARKNQDVTFICAHGSKVQTNKVFPITKAFFDTVSKKEWEILPDKRLAGQLIVPFEVDLHLTLLELLQKEKFDIVHFHSTPPFYGLPFASRINVPSVFTLHGVSSPLERSVIDATNSKKNSFISISNMQRNEFPDLTFISTIYHGIPLQDYAFNENGNETMVFASRLKKVKGVEEAIEVAIKTKHQLNMSGDIRSSEEDYFYNTISPLIEKSNGVVRFLHIINHSAIGGFFGYAKLFIFPIQWEEAFGLVLIESMATGTPVVAFARGSVPEVVKDGITGFIVNPSREDIRGNWIIKKTGIEGLCEAVERIYGMSNLDYLQMRKNCREHVEKNFTAERMVNDYEKLYQKILQKR